VTLADLCCYPLVSVADEAKIDLSRYPAVGQWVARIERLSIPPRPSLAAYRKALQRATP
jgi:glutathione S-transferase